MPLGILQSRCWISPAYQRGAGPVVRPGLSTEARTVASGARLVRGIRSGPIRRRFRALRGSHPKIFTLGDLAITTDPEIGLYDTAEKVRTFQRETSFNASAKAPRERRYAPSGNLGSTRLSRKQDAQHQMHRNVAKGAARIPTVWAITRVPIVVRIMLSRKKTT